MRANSTDNRDAMPEAPRASLPPPMTVLLLAAAVASVIPSLARADDGAKIPTPVSFASRDCVLEVERTDDPLVQLRWMIPFEDNVLGVHEVPNSRRLQTFAFCRDPRPDEVLPNWINLEEAEGAVVRGELEALPPPEEILSSSAWAVEPGHNGVPGDCVWPIQSPAQRTPFTCDDTERGVTWDTTGVPEGPYVVRAYTYAPNNNLWSARAGVIRISDAPVDARPPLGAILDPQREAKLGVSAPLQVRACVSGASADSLDVEWALATSTLADEASWYPVDASALATTGALSLTAPPEAMNQAIYLRARASSSENDATWQSYAAAPILVSNSFETSARSDGDPDFDFCGHDTPGSSPKDIRGCSISASQSSPCSSVLLLLALIGRRRRVTKIETRDLRGRALKDPRLDRVELL
ncbi:MAG: hypothetical protein ACPHRO_00660 [Nannocystaceae bacterium]